MAIPKAKFSLFKQYYAVSCDSIVSMEECTVVTHLTKIVGFLSWTIKDTTYYQGIINLLKKIDWLLSRLFPYGFYTID